MRRFVMLWAVLALSLFVSRQWSVVKADGWTWTPRQTQVISLIYTYADFYGLRPADRDLLLRVAYRETRFGLALVGDNGRSVGPFQFYDAGVWHSTPFDREFGLNGRWNIEVNVAAAAWCFAHGYQSHWRPSDFPPGSWLPVVPPDPRPRAPEWLPALPTPVAVRLDPQ